MNKTTTKKKQAPKKGHITKEKNEFILFEKQRELEEKLKSYEALVNEFATNQSACQQRKQCLEELAAKVKKERLRCRALECDTIIVENENEILQKKLDIVENKVKTARFKYQEFQCVKNQRNTKEKAHQVLSHVTEVDKEVKVLLQDVNDKTRSIFMRTDEYLQVKTPETEKKSLRNSQSSPVPLRSENSCNTDNASHSDPGLNPISVNDTDF